MRPELSTCIIMAFTGTRTYVGFGFGAIQAGLFLYEAFNSGNFRRLVVAEVLPDVVAAIRATQGYFFCNIAHGDHIETVNIGPIEIGNPTDVQDRPWLIDAISESREIGTAIPSVAYYRSSNPGSLHRILAEGLRRKIEYDSPDAVVYAAENHNHAAEILKTDVMEEISEAQRDNVTAKVQFLNTVIGKMSGLVVNPEDIHTQGLTPVTPGSERAFLVEAFNRILISHIDFGDGGRFQRGIEVFQEKPDLLPFEEAKLYGHNATHALAAYIGAVGGVRHIADLQEVPGMMSFLRGAFIQESGAALIRKHHGLDPLFTETGYQEYADDLLERMMNPYLRDTVERVARDPKRKLGWDDRLIGTIRLVLRQGITPSRYAFGAAAALSMIEPVILEKDTPLPEVLFPLWREASPDTNERQAVLGILEKACRQLRQWREAEFPNLKDFFQQTEEG